MAEPTVQVPVSLIEQAYDLIDLRIPGSPELVAALGALLSQPTPTDVRDSGDAPDTPWVPTTADVRSEFAEFGYTSNWEHRHGHDDAERGRRFDRWLATVQRTPTAEAAREPCEAETYSWDHFLPEQVDAYWIKCDVLGPHDEHEDEHTGLTWRDPSTIRDVQKPA